MDSREKARSRWAWAAIILQGSLFVAGSLGFFQLLLSWQGYAHQGVPMLPFMLRSAILTAATGISLWGLWRSRAWGWVLAFLTDGAMCLLTLSSLLDVPAVLLLRNPKWLAYSILDFAAFALVIHRPVRMYFLGGTGVLPRLGAQQAGQAVNGHTYSGLAPWTQKAGQRKIPPAERSVRALAYFTVAVIVTCLATSYAITLLLGEKGGGAKGFLFFSLLGFEIGGVPSFLFALLLTLAARLLGSNRLWAWLLAGSLLAPGLTLGIGKLVSKLGVPSHATIGTLGILLAGPLYLFNVWWLTIPSGLITAYLCFQMYPWSFGETD